MFEIICRQIIKNGPNLNSVDTYASHSYNPLLQSQVPFVLLVTRREA